MPHRLSEMVLVIVVVVADFIKEESWWDEDVTCTAERGNGFGLWLLLWLLSARAEAATSTNSAWTTTTTTTADPSRRKVHKAVKEFIAIMVEKEQANLESLERELFGDLLSKNYGEENNDCFVSRCVVCAKKLDEEPHKNNNNEAMM